MSNKVLNKAYGKNRNVDSLTVGIIVESMTPAQLRSVIALSVTMLVVAFSSGLWLSEMRGDFDMKAHLIKDTEVSIKDAEEHGRLQRKIDSLETEVESRRIQYEQSLLSQDIHQIGRRSNPRAAPKEAVFIVLTPKANK